MSSSDVLIVGSGHGGAQAAISLRQQGFVGSITIVSSEPDLPYERPPLSKEYLTGEKPFGRILLRPEHFWSQRGIRLVLGQRVTAVEAETHCVLTEGGQRLQYGSLIWAAGGAPRQLSCMGSDLARVHSVRSRGDVDAMLAELAGVTRVVVIGGGYIGLETAAALRKLGKKLVVLEAADRVLSRVAGEPVSRFYEAQHRQEGVEIRTNAIVDCIEEDGGVARGVRLADGSLLPADMVVVGIGITPAVKPLANAGAEVTNGVHVDDDCRTSLPDVYAIGDCALRRNQFAGGAWVRLESVQNANNLAETAARAIAGIRQPSAAVPWFWSKQYDLTLQTVGLSAGYDDLIVRGDPNTRSFSVIYLRSGHVVALDCVNAVKDFAQGRALVQSGAVLPRDKFANSAVALKSMSG